MVSRLVNTASCSTGTPKSVARRALRASSGTPPLDPGGTEPSMATHVFGMSCSSSLAAGLGVVVVVAVDVVGAVAAVVVVAPPPPPPSVPPGNVVGTPPGTVVAAAAAVV